MQDEDELQEVSDVKAEGSDIKKDAEIVAKDSNRIGEVGILCLSAFS